MSENDYHNGEGECATEKQVRFIESLGYSGDGLDKYDASRFIDRILDGIRKNGWHTVCPYCHTAFKAYDNLTYTCPTCKKNVFFLDMKPCTEKEISIKCPLYKQKIGYAKIQNERRYGDSCNCPMTTNEKKRFWWKMLRVLFFVLTYPAFFPYYKRAKKPFMDRAYGLFISFFLAVVWIVGIVILYNIFKK